MNATRTHRNNTAITRLISFTFALMLIFTSLATTGCDTLDSNAIEDEPLNVMFSSQSGEPHRLADHHYTDPAASELDGTWELVSENAAQAGRVTFSTSATQEEEQLFIGQFSGETECSDFSGDFRAKNPRLETNGLNVEATRCNVIVEESMIAVLRRATGYKLDEGLLLIFAGQDAPALVFQSVETKSEDDGGPQIIGPPEVDDDDEPQIIGPPEEDDDEPQIIGPPEEDDGEGQKEKKDQ